jgi:probable F420-dependent oxidoreductase
MMRIGVTLPQLEIGDDPAGVRRYAETVEAMGYQSILVYDHVLGASTSTRPGWSGPYTSESLFHEPFVLFGFLAAVTRRVELTTGVIILPQRQTVLVAKQAAEVDVLSGGRLRLGIGVGWNDVEYEALGENFHNRGVRSEEQIAVLRALWSDTAITFRGRWHTIDNAGIKPLPPRRSIPIWLGGYSEATLERIGRLGDGWITFRAPDEAMRSTLERLRGYAQAAGRDPATIGIEASLSVRQVPEAGWKEYAERWQALGAQSLVINTMSLGLASVDQHLDTLRRVAQALGMRPA